MQNTIAHHRLLAFAVLAFLSSVYVLAAYELLSPIIANIAFTAKEIKGAADYRTVQQWLFDRHKGSVAPRDVIAGIELKARDSAAPSWTRAAQALAADPTASMERLDDVLRKLIRDIGDESNLILDPAISTYYAAAFLLNDVPLYLNRVRKPQVADNADLAAHFKNTAHALDQICREARAPCADLRRNMALVRQDILTDAPAPPLESFAHLAAAAQAAFDVLVPMLNQRLESALYERNRLIVIIVLFYVALLSLLVFSLKNHVSQKEIALARRSQRLAVQLQQKNSELESFAHAAAHDLKEPVRTMSCYAALLASEYAATLDPAARGYTGVIERTAKRAERMINDLLAYARMSEKPLVAERCDTAKEMESVLEDLKNHIDEVRPHIDVGILPTLDTVPSMFRRVMANLIDNALKYRDHGRLLTITVTARRDGEDWVFTVADNGIGIDEKHFATVFEPFRRLYPDVYKEGQGTGLTACKKIVERLGGRIWVMGNADGGASVSFTLPANN